MKKVKGKMNDVHKKKDTARRVVATTSYYHIINTTYQTISRLVNALELPGNILHCERFPRLDSDTTCNLLGKNLPNLLLLIVQFLTVEQIKGSN
jgi:hypothetical protein